MLLKFKTNDLRPLVEHAAKAKEHRSSFSGKNGPALWLVHDEGIYFMSNGLPLMPEDQRCVYAKGFPPDQYVGGDDFVEVFPLKKVKGWLNGSEVEITLSAETMEVEVYN
jgi:hypothetical protein